MHDLRTWILKEEVNDINIMMVELKKPWKQHGCSIMFDSWTHKKSRCLINFFFMNSLADTWFLKSIDTFDTIKNGELIFKYLERWLKKLERRMLCNLSLIMPLIM